MNVPSLKDYEQLGSGIFMASIPFYILFRRGKLWNRGFMNHLLFIALSYYASHGWASVLLNSRLEAARQNNVQEEAHQLRMQAKTYGRALNPDLLRYLQIEGMSYLSDDFLQNDPETKAFVSQHPIALQRRAFLINEQIKDTIVLDSPEESAGEAADDCEDEDE